MLTSGNRQFFQLLVGHWEVPVEAARLAGLPPEPGLRTAARGGGWEAPGMQGVSALPGWHRRAVLHGTWRPNE